MENKEEVLKELKKAVHDLETGKWTLPELAHAAFVTLAYMVEQSKEKKMP